MQLPLLHTIWCYNCIASFCFCEIIYDYFINHSSKFSILYYIKEPFPEYKKRIECFWKGLEYDMKTNNTKHNKPSLILTYV